MFVCRRLAASHLVSSRLVLGKVQSTTPQAVVVVVVQEFNYPLEGTFLSFTFATWGSAIGIIWDVATRFMLRYYIFIVFYVEEVAAINGIYLRGMCKVHLENEMFLFQLNI